MSEDNAAQSGSSDSHESHHGAKQTTTAAAGSEFKLSKSENLAERAYSISSTFFFFFCFSPHA